MTAPAKTEEKEKEKEKPKGFLWNLIVKKTNEKVNVTVKEKKKKKKTENAECDEETIDETIKENSKLQEKDRPVPTHMRNPTPEQKVAYEAFVRSTLALGVEGLLKEYVEELKPYLACNFTRELFDQNPTKNRYKDILCNDLTRVIIADGKGSDYIHANHVKGDPLYNSFILTQGPMPSTVVDFWRMIVHLKVYHIIMLCEAVEGGKTKCEQYWPEKIGQKMVHGDVTIVNKKISTADSHIRKSYLEVESGKVRFQVRHHHWRTWPDKSVPQSSLAALRVLQATRCSPRPVVVHCSAGIGRTGSLAAIEMCLQSLLDSQTLKMLDVCRRLRDQRMLSVQVDVQYVYVAQTIMEYGKAMGFWAQPDLLEEFAKFKAFFDKVIKVRLADYQPQLNNVPAANANKTTTV